MKYSLAVFIGRFQPFHLGHQRVVDEALQVADRVLILMGSSFEPRSLRNPWFFDERETMIRSCYTEDENKCIFFEPLMDVRYNDTLWVTQVQQKIYDFDQIPDNKITLIGQRKKGTGFYTSRMPQWDNHPVEPIEDLHGMDIRAYLLGGGNTDALEKQVPAQIIPSLVQFMASTSGQTLRQEYDFIQAYKKNWENVPFEPTHVTVDAVVIQSGHILVVKRGAHPGKGLLALPGGFIHHEETLTDAIIRKLREETQIKVPAPVLMGSIKNQMVFDDPYRSARGRTITHTFHIELRGEKELPKIKGGGETDKCFWLPLGQLDSNNMFEDHYFIIQRMLGTL